MKLLYPSIGIGTIHDSILAKASKHPSDGQGQRFNRTVADTYTRLPTIYSNTSDDVDTIVIIGGAVIDLVEEEENATADDDFDFNFDFNGDPLEERKSTESSAVLPRSMHTRTKRNRHQNPNTVNFQLDSPIGYRTEVRIIVDTNQSSRLLKSWHCHSNYTGEQGRGDGGHRSSNG
jgi:hypothetical protein